MRSLLLVALRFRWLMLSLAAGLAPACTDRFAALNTDPSTAANASADQLFARALKYGTLYDNDFQVGEHLHANMWVQFFANSTPGFGTDRYESNDQWATRFWTGFYTGYGMDLAQAIRQVEQQPGQVNRLSQARIWRAFLFQRITDYWGDVPYLGAFGGGTGNSQPAYEPQASIYPSLLRELTEAAAALDDTQPGNFGPADLLYANPEAAFPAPTVAGANQRWRHFANSLRLRTAMRLARVAPALAQQQVRAALAAGVMSSRSESAIMNNTGGSVRINQNPLAVVLGFQDCRVSATLVDYLRRLDDPRLPVYVAAVSATNPNLVGLPNGLTASELTLPTNNPAYFSLAGTRFQDAAHDQYLLTYAEVCFLRAEACLRGWDAAGTAEQWYLTGIYEAMQQTGVTSGTTVALYSRGGGVRFEPGQELERIITQKWLSLFGHNGFEAYAEYRRTGFPVLHAVANPGETNGQVPRRLRYPLIEQRLNPDSYQAALRSQGPDLLSTPVWWDK
ncbi:SusD/RagB family nutrient-binding outer membrane lipoprotein [Hymenobacter rubripertinctus]|uniref:SusD/RagB family nutrient-binding outer membrane lipoprotein n=1 Tax=Hymenobacter rubripertinctus TaxID=2029981 RepID=A0A418QJT8_9BACT|nr:SusD/RagB family nutrient-binding outer membrane lipoprotein [Hymenobacter rubripertinctus]RIY05400.1 SusD/RagB family nutrient-binding outer membrane lipoprotein [Hymenobacter rubripertinctus]